MQIDLLFVTVFCLFIHVAVKKCAVPLQYSCVNNITCLPAIVECDGHVDCMDGSDEEDCPPLELPCQPDEMDCGGVSGGCVFLGDVCNGVEDCHNGIDEEDCSKYECVCVCVCLSVCLWLCVCEYNSTGSAILLEI